MYLSEEMSRMYADPKARIGKAAVACWLPRVEGLEAENARLREVVRAAQVVFANEWEDMHPVDGGPDSDWCALEDALDALGGE